MSDLNRRLQHVFVRRAVERTRFENSSLKSIAVAWVTAEAGLVYLIKHSGIFTGTRSPFGLTDATPITTLLSDMAGVIGSTLHAELLQLTADLKALTELELRELPSVMQQELLKAAGVVQESDDEVSDDDPALQGLLEYIVKVKEGYRIISHRTGKNLGTFKTRAAAKKHLKHLARFREELEVSEAAGDFPINVPPVFQPFLETQIAELITSPLGGARYAQSFVDLSTSIVARLRNTLMTGLAQGQSTAQVTRAVQGLLRNSTFQAERIVRSEYTRVANQAALTLFDQNRDLLKGVQWLATLDDRTCLQCGVIDGKTWSDPTDALVPVVDTHPSCRCVLTPVFKSAASLGLPRSLRQTFTGSTPPALRYQDWFAQQDATMQQEILGPTRYRLYTRGGYRLPNFASARGIRSVQSLLSTVKAT